MIRKFQFPEGATPIDDVSGLKLTWVQTLTDLNRVEAENISRAQKIYLEQSIDDPSKWFSLSYLKKIHLAMFGQVWDWAGKWRKSMTNIEIKPQFIPSRLADFCSEIASWSTEPVELTFIERSARIHHQLAAIHPFENGNGRFSRFIADRYLLAYRCPHPIWPSEMEKEGQIRSLYIQSLQAADRRDYQPLIQLMRQFQAKDPSLDDLSTSRFYEKRLNSQQIQAILKAILRI